MEQFDELLAQIPELSEGLEKIDNPPGDAYAEKAGVYVLFENNKPMHVGGTKNLQQRISSHRSNVTSFAVRLMQEQLNMRITFRDAKLLIRRNEGRFRDSFRASLARIKKMELRFVEIDKSKIESYELRERAKLYIASKLGVSVEGLDT